MLELLSSRYQFIRLPNEKSDKATVYVIPGQQGTFAIISMVSEPFCGGCRPLRLTADGILKNCLFSKSEVNILSALRNGQDILPVTAQCMFDQEESLEDS